MLVSRPVILASNSPRREQLLRDTGINFVIKSKNVKEYYNSSLKREQIPLYLSQIKAEAFKDEITNEIVIAADTIVHLDGKILEKPIDKNHAIEMLLKLSDKCHEVITGVTILTKESSASFFEITKVYFAEMNVDIVEYYVNKFNPLDKAGAYGIQEWIGLTHVRKIEGCYYNVMGLPVQRLFVEIAKIKI